VGWLPNPKLCNLNHQHPVPTTRTHLPTHTPPHPHPPTQDPSELSDDERARLIAGSATANILLKKVCEQEIQLAAGAKLTQDLKAALLLVCGVLKQTSFVDADVSLLFRGFGVGVGVGGLWGWRR